MTPVPDESVENNYIEIDGNSLPTDYDEDRMWYVFSGEEVGDALQDLIDSITDAETGRSRKAIPRTNWQSDYQKGR